MTVNPEFLETIFGEGLDYDIPNGCDLVVLCVDTTHHEPISLLLPHQIFKKDLQQLIQKYDARSITIIPVRSNEKLTFNIEKIISDTSQQGETESHKRG